MEGLEKLSKIIEGSRAELIEAKGGVYCLDVSGNIFRDKLDVVFQRIINEVTLYLKNTPRPNYWKLLFLLEGFYRGDYGVEWEGKYKSGSWGAELENLILRIRKCHKRFSSSEELKESVAFYWYLDDQKVTEGTEVEEEAKDQLNLKQSEKIYWDILAEDGDERKAYQASKDFLIANGLQRGDDFLGEEDDLKFEEGGYSEPIP